VLTTFKGLERNELVTTKPPHLKTVRLQPQTSTVLVSPSLAARRSHATRSQTISHATFSSSIGVIDESQASTAQASSVTLLPATAALQAIPSVHRSGKFCHTDEYRGRDIAAVPSVHRSGKFCHSPTRSSHVPSVHRSGKFCHSPTLITSSTRSRSPKRPPLRQVLSPATGNHGRRCAARGPSVHRSGKFCHVPARAPERLFVLSSQASTAQASSITRGLTGLPSQASTAQASSVTC
jgi:hypothetical protein